jgi:hypothetical protein
MARRPLRARASSRRMSALEARLRTALRRRWVRSLERPGSARPTAASGHVTWPFRIRRVSGLPSQLLLQFIQSGVKRRYMDGHISEEMGAIGFPNDCKLYFQELHLDQHVFQTPKMRLRRWWSGPAKPGCLGDVRVHGQIWFSHRPGAGPGNGFFSRATLAGTPRPAIAGAACPGISAARAIHAHFARPGAEDAPARAESSHYSSHRTAPV